MAAPFTLISIAFQQGESLNTRYTCDGENISPPLQWEAVPHGTKSLALIVEDPDAPDPAHPKTTWVHWIVYNIPPQHPGFEEGIPELPPGVLSGLNDWDETSYGGPCPPIGRHRYFFKLYALDIVLPDLNQPTKQHLESAMDGHILAEARLMATYQKQNIRGQHPSKLKREHLR